MLAFTLRALINIPNEVFRKTLHFILLGSLYIWTFLFETWWMTALSAIVFAAITYPILMLSKRLKCYSAMVTERKPGELKQSLIVVYVMYALVVSICWGWMDDKYLVLCSIYAWGFGDAIAALVGKKFGRHFIEGKYIEGRKSIEGTAAMFVVSFISVLLILMMRGGLAWYAYLIISILTAAVSAFIELYTLNGMDTISCPVAAMTVLVPLVYMFGGGL